MNQVNEVLKFLVSQRGKNQSDVARKLGISSQLLGQYINGRQKPKAGFYIKWKETFKEDLLSKIERNVSHETYTETSLISDVTIKLSDYLQELKSNQEFYKEIIRSGLIKFAANSSNLEATLLRLEAKLDEPSSPSGPLKGEHMKEIDDSMKKDDSGARKDTPDKVG